VHLVGFYYKNRPLQNLGLLTTCDLNNRCHAVCRTVNTMVR